MMQKVHVEDHLQEQESKIGRIFTHDKMDIMNIQLRAGGQVPEHNAKEVVTIIVRKGEVKFTVEGTEHLLTTDDILVMEPFEMHSLQAITDIDILVLKTK